MSKKLEYPIERFLYNDDYVSNDLEILEVVSEKVREDTVDTVGTVGNKLTDLNIAEEKEYEITIKIEG